MRDTSDLRKFLLGMPTLISCSSPGRTSPIKTTQTWSGSSRTGGTSDAASDYFGEYAKWRRVIQKYKCPAHVDHVMQCSGLH